MTDVIVAGGGVVGGAVAFELAQRGLTVTLVSPFQAAGTASAAAGAMLGALGETTAADRMAARLAASNAARAPATTYVPRPMGGRCPPT